MENGKWKMGNGKWEMENGKWEMEKGEWEKLRYILPVTGSVTSDFRQEPGNGICKFNLV
jgi:hypothetical protein